jgi:hypothetical protein
MIAAIFRGNGQEKSALLPMHFSPFGFADFHFALFLVPWRSIAAYL